MTKIWRANGKILGRMVGISWYGPTITIQGELHAELWPTPDLSQGEINKEYPLFPGLAEIYEEAERRGDWLCYGFPYFLVLADARAFNYRGSGLWDRGRGVITIQHEQEKIQLRGDEKLYHELREIYEQWVALGKPKASDYQIEFAPIELDSATLQSDEDANIWVIRRKFYWQIVRYQPAAKL